MQHTFFMQLWRTGRLYIDPPTTRHLISWQEVCIYWCNYEFVKDGQRPKWQVVSKCNLYVHIWHPDGGGMLVSSRCKCVEVWMWSWCCSSPTLTSSQHLLSACNVANTNMLGNSYSFIWQNEKNTEEERTMYKEKEGVWHVATYAATHTQVLTQYLDGTKDP